MLCVCVYGIRTLITPDDAKISKSTPSAFDQNLGQHDASCCSTTGITFHACVTLWLQACVFWAAAGPR